MKTFEKSFTVRCIVCYFLCLCLLLFGDLRVVSVNMKDYAALQQAQSTVMLPAGRPRGSILDTNGAAITNSYIQTVAAVNPTQPAISAVKSLLYGEERARVLALLEKGMPAVCVLEKPVECDGVTCTGVPLRVTENTVAHHFTGYLDGNGKGAYGIEKAYNNLLSSEEDLNAVFTVSGKGKPLLGVDPYFTGGQDALSNAVWLTIDINVQKKTEQAAAGLKSGAVIVAESKTNKIRAAVSLPDFSPDDISASLDKENSPLMNKCLNCYNAGSVFKPCIAAKAIDLSQQSFTVDCTGKTEIENRVFNCHKRQGHGLQTLADALKNSCNCYFYELAARLGAQELFTAAEVFSFGSRIRLADGLFTEQGTLPDTDGLKTLSSKANFGIGQGDILVSPVSMLNLYSAIANNGYYYLPSIVEKTVKDGKISLYNAGAPTFAMSENAAKTLKKALSQVVEEGTGTAAKSNKVSSAGKTATAQTGRRNKDGSEITNSWFCGFFPAENPVYTVIVMADGEYEKSPAEVFRDISEVLS